MTQPRNADSESTTERGAAAGAETQIAPKRRRWRPTRRGFLIGLGVAGGGLALGVTFGLPAVRLRAAQSLESSGPPGGFDADPTAWFQILPDNRVQLYVTKVEMGQGIHSAIAQIAAEELSELLRWEDLEVVQASTHSGPTDAFGTGASASVSTTYEPLRQAAATLREMLRSEAARVLGVAPDALAAHERAFVVRDEPSRRITLGELAVTQTDWDVPAEPVPLKAPGDFTRIGQSLPRKDIVAKVTGEAIYGYDMRAPGMLYGAVARPPTIGATMKIAWPLRAREMPGVRAVVVDTENDFVAVAAESRAQAAAALEAMQIEWDPGRLWQQAELEEMVQVGNGGGVTIQKEGNAPRALQESTTHAAEYFSPFAVQSPLEPQAALADVRTDGATMWVSTQSQERMSNLVAAALGMRPEQVNVQPTYLGGGFGRKLDAEVAVEAARLSQAAGAPVHVGWTRGEEMRYGYFRPPTHNKLFARLREDGGIDALEHRQASGDVAFPFLPSFLSTVLGADFGAWRGSLLQYDVPHRQVTAWRRQLPVRTGWWRGLGLLANTFAVEGFMDELAHLAGADPLAFRLDHLPEDDWGRRMARVLQAAAETADWGGPLPNGRARGIACCTDVDTVVAQVAEVSLDASSGQVRVHRISCAVDCGLVINPNGVEAQVQGNIMWGVGSTLLEEMTIRNGRVDLENFDTYPLLTMRQAPHVETVILEAGDGRPRGMGEPPIGPVAAAIGNALFSLTGVRIRRLPMTPDRVLEALA